MSFKNPIIFVWIGNPPPSFLDKSISFSIKRNPKRIFYILSDSSRSRFKFANNFKNLKIIKIKELPNQSQFLGSEFLFRGNFWKYTSQRFEVLSDFVEKNNINKFFHAEIDNLLFNFDKLDWKLDKIGNGIFVPRDSIDRGIASFIYCNKKSCLKDILKMYLPGKNASNDMHALGLYANQNKNFYSLPTESFAQNVKLWDIISPNECQGIFDAAAIGQYCLGIDPNNNRYNPTFNLFRNENSRVNFDKLEIISDNKELFIRLPESKIIRKIYNIHVHSKNIRMAIELINKEKIYNYLTLKKKVVVAHKFKFLAGPILKVFDFIMLGLRKLAKFTLYEIYRIFKIKNKK